MKRNLSDIRAELAAKTKEIAPLAERFINAGDDGLAGDDLTSFQSLRAQIEQLKGEERDATLTAEERAGDLRAAEEMQAMFEEYNKPSGRSASGRIPKNGQTEQEDTRSLGRRFVESDQFKHYRDNVVGQGGSSRPFAFGSMRDEEMGQRALITSTTLASVMPEHKIPGIMAGDVPELRMRDIFMSGRTNTNLVEFVKEGVLTNNATEVAEATAISGGSGATAGIKPESGFTLTPGSAPVRTIATLLYIPRSALDDAEQMESYINQLLARFVAEREDKQLLVGNGVAPNLQGINGVSGRLNLNGAYWVAEAATGLSPVDRIRRAKTEIRMNRGRSSAVVLHPERLEAIETMKKESGSNEYLLPNGGPFGTATVPRLWNLPVIEHEDQAYDEATVVDGRAAMVFDRMNAQIFVTDSNRDLFERNIITILCESRLAFPIFFPNRIAVVDLDATTA